MEKAELSQFDPDVYIEIDDVMSGGRKLARVTETGTAYVDLADDDATPFPIHAELNPQEMGNILGWGLYIVDHRPEEHDSFRALVDRLIASGKDVLTYNRAAHWAFKTRDYDYLRALAAGVAETERIRAGRQKMDGIVRASGALQ